VDSLAPAHRTITHCLGASFTFLAIGCGSERHFIESIVTHSMTMVIPVVAHAANDRAIDLLGKKCGNWPLNADQRAIHLRFAPASELSNTLSENPPD
jgi:hypothetical protein